MPRCACEPLNPQRLDLGGSLDDKGHVLLKTVPASQAGSEQLMSMAAADDMGRRLESR